MAMMLGERTFDGGLPCSRCQSSLRYTKGGACVACAKAASLRQRLAKEVPDDNDPAA